MERTIIYLMVLVIALIVIVSLIFLILQNQPANGIQPFNLLNNGTNGSEPNVGAPPQSPHNLLLKDGDIVVEDLWVTTENINIYFDLKSIDSATDSIERQGFGSDYVYGCNLSIDGTPIYAVSYGTEGKFIDSIHPSMPGVFQAYSFGVGLETPGELNKTIGRRSQTELCCRIYYIEDYYSTPLGGETEHIQRVEPVSNEICQWASFRWVNEDYMWLGVHVKEWRNESGPYCGDAICQEDENCSSCSEDCDACPTSPVPLGPLYPRGENDGAKHSMLKHLNYGFYETDADICLENDKPIVYFFGRERKYSGSMDDWSRSAETVINEVVEAYGNSIVFRSYPYLDTSTPAPIDLLDFAGRYDVNYQKGTGNLAVPTIIIACKYVKVGATDVNWAKQLMIDTLYPLTDVESKPKEGNYTMTIWVTDDPAGNPKEVRILDVGGNIISSQSADSDEFIFKNLPEENGMKVEIEDKVTGLTVSHNLGSPDEWTSILVIPFGYVG